MSAAPLPRRAYAGLRADGTWMGRVLDGEVALFLEASEVVVRCACGGDELACAFDEVTGAEVHGGTLVLHARRGTLTLRGEGATVREGWAVLGARACALPEVARGVRWRETGADDGAAYARYLAPLLEARRRLEHPESLEWRLAGFGGDGLRTRILSTLRAMAAERHPTDASRGRALAARLVDAARPLVAAVATSDAALAALLEAPDARRYEAWRAWVRTVPALFTAADRAWTTVAPLVEAGGGVHAD